MINGEKLVGDNLRGLGALRFARGDLYKYSRTWL